MTLDCEKLMFGLVTRPTMKDDEAKKEDEPMYPKTDFYPFYMARPR